MNIHDIVKGLTNDQAIKKLKKTAIFKAIIGGILTYVGMKYYSDSAYCDGYAKGMDKAIAQADGVIHTLIADGKCTDADVEEVIKKYGITNGL